MAPPSTALGSPSPPCTLRHCQTQPKTRAGFPVLRNTRFLRRPVFFLSVRLYPPPKPVELSGSVESVDNPPPSPPHLRVAIPPPVRLVHHHHRHGLASRSTASISPDTPAKRLFYRPALRRTLCLLEVVRNRSYRSPLIARRGGPIVRQPATTKLGPRNVGTATSLGVSVQIYPREGEVRLVSLSRGRGQGKRATYSLLKCRPVLSCSI